MKCEKRSSMKEMLKAEETRKEQTLNLKEMGKNGRRK
jgi:hypothetical protein